VHNLDQPVGLPFWDTETVQRIRIAASAMSMKRICLPNASESFDAISA